MHGVGDNDRLSSRLAVGKLRGLRDKGGEQSSSRPFSSWSRLSRQLHRAADRSRKKSLPRLARGSDRQSGTGCRLAEGSGRCSRPIPVRGMQGERT